MKKLKITAVVVVAILATLFMAFHIYLDKDDQEKKSEFERYWLNAVEEKERINVLVMGVDVVEGKVTVEQARTDTMMVLSIDPKTKTGFMLSVPRDSRVFIEEKNRKTKINNAHVFGGVELAVSTVKKVLNIPIHHYIRVNYDALMKTVDDVGGVQINVPQDMDWDDNAGNLHIHLKAGVQTLNGQQAMEFMRFRHGYANMDLGRIEAQQNFLDALIHKLMSPQSIARIPKYLETMYQYVDTDMSKKEIISIAATAIKINPDLIEKKTVEGQAKTINGTSYFIIDEEQQKKLMEYLLTGEYQELVAKQKKIEEEEAVQTKSEEKPLYRIYVYNGCGTSGIARRVSDLLKIEDLPISHSGNAGNFDYEKTSIYYKDNKKLAERIAEILEVGEIKEGTRAVDYREPDVVIIIGSDFNK